MTKVHYPDAFGNALCGNTYGRPRHVAKHPQSVSCKTCIKVMKKEGIRA